LTVDGGIDPYIDPDTGLLRNLLGITDAAILDAAEAAFTYFRIYELEIKPLAGQFDLSHFQAIHRYITQDLVDWAGEIRTVNIGKGSLFCLVENIQGYASELFSRLATNEYLMGRRRDAFVKGLVDFYGDFNALHPFREFNGRAQRTLTSQLAHRAGWRVAWERLDGVRNVEASAASLAGNMLPMQELLDELVQKQDPH
jgi:cell filamentation protein